jgi:tetratricopeptide (TPR) repeat protein
MSSTEEMEASNICCANCGIPEVDEVKLLEDCDGCDLVKYCGNECKEDHKEKHEEECKKRKAQLHDKRLFTQPGISHRGECPLCFLPMPLASTKFGFWPCCSKLICDGCSYANYKSNGNNNCPFCREPTANREECIKRLMKRVKANDPTALRETGLRCYQERDYDVAFEYLTKAAELSDTVAHDQLGIMYRDGDGVKKDDEKGVYHLEKAAIGGHPGARYNLAAVEHNDGNIERAANHFIIAANLGHELSMKRLWEYYKRGKITKEDLESTLRTHKAALDEMKSPEREAASNWKPHG